MKYYLPIDHLPVGPMIYDFANPYKHNGYTAGGLTYSDFNVEGLNTGVSWDVYELVDIAGVKWITSISTRGTSYAPGTFPHGGVANQYAPKLFCPATTTPNFHLSFKIKFLEDRVNNINKRVFLTNVSNKVNLFYEDFGDFKQNDEFEITSILSGGTSKTYIDGVLTSEFDDAYSTGDKFWYWRLGFRQVDISGRTTPAFVFRDLCVTTDDDTINRQTSVNGVPLSSTEHPNIVVPYQTTAEVPWVEHGTVFPNEIKETLNFTCFLEQGIKEVALTASIMVDKPTSRPIRYWLSQDGVVISNVGVIYPRLTRRCGRRFPLLSIDKEYDHTRQIDLTLVVFDD